MLRYTSDPMKTSLKSLTILGTILGLATSPITVFAKPSISTVSFPSSLSAGVAATLSASVSSAAPLQSCNLYIDSDDKGAMTIAGNMASMSYTFQFSGVYTAFVFCRDTSGGIASGSNTSIFVQTGPTQNSDAFGGGSSSKGSAPVTAPAAPITPAQVITATASLPTGIVPGNLIKTECATNASVDDACKAVYYVGKDGKRHGFPNSKAFFTWYSNFDTVTTVTAQQMSAIPLGKNVTYRPGKKMVKFTTLNNVYVVGKGGVLRWVTSEPLAVALYGADWNKLIDDVPDTVYTNYTFGPDVTQSGEFLVTSVMDSAPTIDDTL